MKTLTVITVLLLQGCAALEFRDYRDRPWDPRPGQLMFEQIPNWDQEAQRVCGNGRSTKKC